MFDIKSNYNDKIIRVEIPVKHKTICVSVSGGADSALLLWNILRYQKQTNNRFKVIIYTTSPRTRRYFNFYHALQVQRWIFNDIKFKGFDRQIHPPSTKINGFDHDYVWCTFHTYENKTSAQYSHMRKIGSEYKPTLFISGRTSWPQSKELPPYWVSDSNNPIQVAEALSYARSSDSPVLERLQDTDPNADKWFAPDTFYYIPLISMDKKWIWGSYKHYKIAGLWNATRSCEGNGKILDGNCGTCWWCLERKWAKS